jgi:CRISPR-associated protein Cas1
MNQARSQKIVMDGYGSYLGMEKGCFTLKDKKGNVERYPLFEKQLKEVVLRSGNMVSTGALASLGFWDVDTLILTQRGKPVAMLRSLDDDSHVKTRICQYQALENEKGIEVAKRIVYGKIEGQNQVLEKYGLVRHDLVKAKVALSRIESENQNKARRKLVSLEGKFTERYFKQIFELLPEALRPEKRKKFKAYDGTNNIFNLAYTMLKWRVHRAILGAKLEPFLGFVHSEQHGKPSLVCDLMELYRYLVDDFVIQFSQGLKPKDFVVKGERTTRKRWGKREYLNTSKTRELEMDLNRIFSGMVEVPRIKHGSRQTLETLINEEALLLAKFLREEKEEWVPRLAIK